MRTNFEVGRVTDEIIAFIRAYFEKNHLGGVVLGISGGKDSAVVAGLFSMALGAENVVGLYMPCCSRHEDGILASKVCEHFGFKLHHLNLNPVFEAFNEEFKNTFIDDYAEKDLVDAHINIKPRLRMLSCYYAAQYLSNLNKVGYVVAGTSNQCEIYVGYFTKGGDSVHDISVLANLTVAEVIAIGEYIKVPNEVLYRPPDDGISGMTDEEKLGVTYDEIAEFIQNGTIGNKEHEEKIKKYHQKNLHKLNPIPTFRVE